MSELTATNAPAPAVGRRRRWPWIVAALVLVPTVLFVALAIGIDTDAGRAHVARVLEGFVSDGIRGSMTVGSVESISLDGIVGRNVRFTDEADRLVLSAEEAELAVDWLELVVSGRFVCSHGRVHGARVFVETLESGALTITSAFAPTAPGPAAAPVGPDTVHLAGLVASGVEVLVTVDGAPEIRATHLSAVVMVRVPENGGVHLGADRIDGRVHVDAPVPLDLSFAGGTLSVAGDALERASIELPARLSGEAITVEVAVRIDRRDALFVDVHLVPRDLGAAIVSTPLLAQALLAEVGSHGGLDVTVDLP